mmetsp:Transcript_10347/g.29491  ORF Transcript_10347/g.29491 Transcript_10347/m.29491 type:complete len:232 (-) Transcript_10347:266-961(-)
MGDDLFHLLLHLVLLCRLNVSDLLHGLGADAGSIDFDLVGVHGGVGHQDLGVLDALGLPDANLLVKDEALVKKGLLEGSPGPLDDLNRLEVRGALQPEDGVHSELGKMVLVLGEDLGAQRGAGNIEQVLPEGLYVRLVVKCDLLQPGLRNSGGLTEAGDDGHRVEVLVDEELRLAEELATQDCHRGCPVPDLIILDLGYINKHFCCSIVDIQRLEDCGTVVCDSDGFPAAH